MEYENSALAFQATEAKFWRRKLKTGILRPFAGYFPPQNVRYLCLSIQSNHFPFVRPKKKEKQKPNQNLLIKALLGLSETGHCSKHMAECQ